MNALDDGPESRTVVNFKGGAAEKELAGFGQAGKFMEAFDGVAHGVE